MRPLQLYHFLPTLLKKTKPNQKTLPFLLKNYFRESISQENRDQILIYYSILSKDI